MKSYQPLWLLMLVMATGNAWAYGDGGGGKKACAKPKFSEFTPVNNASVAARSAFSFTASANTHPESISVMIRDQPVAITVTPKSQGFQVAGALPATLTEGFARISISADGPNQCKGGDGWLVKIIE